MKQEAQKGDIINGVVVYGDAHDGDKAAEGDDRHAHDFFYDGNDARRGAILGPARVTLYRANFLSISIL